MRRVVKTEWAEIAIPEIEFEVKKQTGLITTVEGILDRAVEGLQQTIRAVTIADFRLSSELILMSRVQTTTRSRGKRSAIF